MLKRKKGQSVGEWTLMIAVIAVISMGVLFALTPKMMGLLQCINKAVFGINNSQNVQ